MDIYVANPKGFSDYKENAFANLVAKYAVLFQVFGYLLNVVNEREGKAVCFMDPIPHISENGQIIGYWYWLIAYEPPSGITSFASILTELFENNSAYMKDVIEGKVKTIKKTQQAFRYLNTKRWKQLSISVFSLPGSYINDTYNIDKVESPFNPCALFRFERQMVAPLQLKGKIAHADPRAYFEVDDNGKPDGFKFIDTNGVYHIADDDMLHYQFHTRYFPWIPRPENVDNRERLLYSTMHSVDNLPDFVKLYNPTVALVLETDQIDEHSKSVDMSYDEHTNVQTTEEEEYTIEVFKAQTISQMANAKAEVARECTEMFQSEGIIDKARQQHIQYKAWSVRRRSEQLIALKRFRQVFSEDGAVADSIKCVAKYMRERLRTHTNFCMPRPKQTKDLTYGGEEPALLVALFETVVQVATNHNMILRGKYSFHQMYQRTSLKLHMLTTGEHSVGKSFGIEVLVKQAIPGTARMVSYATLKSKTAEGRSNDSMYEGYEEAPVSLLNPEKEGKKAGNAGMSEGEGLLKGVLTRGEMDYLAVGDKRSNDSKKIQIQSVIHAACNFALQQIPYAVVSRFDAQECMRKTRDDKPLIAAKMSESVKNSEVSRLTALNLDRSHRDQMMAAFGGYLMFSTAISGVDMSVANIVFANTMKHAKAALLSNTTEMRHAERFFMETSQITFGRAVAIVLDSPVSPLAGEPWLDEHILHLEKHLKATVADCVQALGLLEHQWENKIMYQVVCELNLFMKLQPKEQTNEEKYADDHGGPPANIDTWMTGGEQKRPEEEKKYESASNPKSTKNYLEACPAALRTALTMDGAISTLARIIHTRMDPKPQYSDVQYALTALHEIVVELADGATMTGLQFQFENNNTRVRLAKKIVDGNAQNKLRDCVMKAVCTKYAKPQTVLYCQPDPLIPAKFQTLDIKPDPNAPTTTVYNPRYRPAEMVSWTKAYMDGVDGASLKPRENVNFEEMWTQDQDLVIDVDLDDWGEQKHNENIALCEDEIDDAPSNNTAILERQIKDTMDNREYAKLKSYKEWFKMRTEDEKKVQMQANPKRYSMLEEAEAIKRRRTGPGPVRYFPAVVVPPKDYIQEYSLSRALNQIELNRSSQMCE